MYTTSMRLMLCASVCALSMGCTGTLSDGDAPPIDRYEPRAPEELGKDPLDPMTEDPEVPGNPQDPDEPAVEPLEILTFMCDQDQRLADLPLKRLSRTQYVNALHDALATSLSGSEVQDILAQASLEQAPDDVPGRAVEDTHGGYKQLDQAVRQEHVDGSFEIARSIGAQISQDTALMGKLIGACATDNDADNDAQCIDDWIDTFGARVLGEALSDADHMFYRGVYGAQGIDRDGVADVITVLFTAPQFLYHVEHGQQPDTPDDGSPYELGPFELANRLAFTFWQTIPDDELFATARDGSLLQEDVYLAQLDRIVSDPRAERSVRDFFRAWLWLDELRNTGDLVGTPRYDAFAGEDSPSTALREQMIEEILDMAVYYTLTTDGSFSDFLNSDRVFAREQELANLYGVEPWDGTSEPGFMPEGERAGLISRAALLFNNTIATAPIRRGFFIRRALLCVQPPPPPDNAAGVEIPISETATTREVVEAVTEVPGSDCSSCHQIYINPLGFALEGYDALGRVRDEQPLFDELGNLVVTRPLDTTSKPQVRFGDPTPSTGARDLIRMLDESKDVHKCLAQNYARWTLSRVEDMQADGCLMEELRAQIVADQPIREVFKSIALRPDFKRRHTASQGGQP